MKFSELVDLVKGLPAFETGFLLSGDVNANYLRKQISLWVNSGKIVQLRRGLYILTPPYQQVKPHPFYLANHIQSASYVSFQSALSYYGLISEHVPVTTSITTKRPGVWETPVGTFTYRHIKNDWFNNYTSIDLGGGLSAFIANPEKALLDLILLEPKSGSAEYMQELRLQNLDVLDLNKMRELVERSRKPKLARAFKHISRLALDEKKGYKQL